MRSTKTIDGINSEEPNGKSTVSDGKDKTKSANSQENQQKTDEKVEEPQNEEESPQLTESDIDADEIADENAKELAKDCPQSVYFYSQNLLFVYMSISTSKAFINSFFNRICPKLTF